MLSGTVSLQTQLCNSTGRAHSGRKVPGQPAAPRHGQPGGEGSAGLPSAASSPRSRTLGTLGFVLHGDQGMGALALMTTRGQQGKPPPFPAGGLRVTSAHCH